MEELDLADPELVLIINITENKVCNDCQKKNPRWCSINNAVLLCPSCARKHQKYNKIISEIKSLEGDLWTKDDIKRLYIGGNERFNKVLTSYNIPLTNENAEYKYHTKIAAYYRNLLNEELKDKKIIDLVKPSLKEGIELICKEDYDKLNQYIPSQDNILQNNKNSNNNSDVLNIPKSTYSNPFSSDINNNNKNSNIFNDNTAEFSIEKHLNDFVDVMDSIFGNKPQKAENTNYNEKLTKEEEYIKDKKEKRENSDTFNGFMNTLSSGIDNFVRKTENFFNEVVENNNRRNVNRFNITNQNQNRMNNNNYFNNNNLNQNSLNKNINIKNNKPINNNNNKPLNNLSNNNLVQNQNNLSDNNNANNNFNNANINAEDIGAPKGCDDIPKLIYSNNPQNINIQGEQKNNNIEGDFEGLDGK